MENQELIIEVEMDTHHVTTYGMTSMKGNIDGTVSFEESGIDEDMEEGDIEQYFHERYGNQYDVSVRFK